jgi:hypothetical protein
MKIWPIDDQEPAFGGRSFQTADGGEAALEIVPVGAPF